MDQDMESGSSKKVCPVCGGGRIRSIYRDRIALHTHTLFPRADDPRLDQKGDIEILCCDECLHGFHGVGTGAELATEFYGTGEYSMSYFGQTNSARLTRVGQVILDLKTSHGFDSVLEVGCGTGELLRPLAAQGLRCYGVDMNPAVLRLERVPNLEITCADINEYAPYRQFGFVLARLFLEHVDDPRAILRRLREFAAPHSFVLLEVPNATRTLQDGRFFDYYHEHRQYFSLRSMRKLLASVGMCIREVHLDPMETIMIVVAQRGETPADDPGDAGSGREIDTRFLLRELVAHLEKACAALWWGAGFTGARLLSSVPPELWPSIDVVDGDPAKKGKYLGGSRRQVGAVPQDIGAPYEMIFVASIASAKEIVTLLRKAGCDKPVLHLAARGPELFVTDTV